MLERGLKKLFKKTNYSTDLKFCIFPIKKYILPLEFVRQIWHDQVGILLNLMNWDGMTQKQWMYQTEKQTLHCIDLFSEKQIRRETA